MSKSILIVDEDKDSAQLLKEILVNAGFEYRCITTDSLDEVQGLIRHHNIDTILFDKESSNEFLLKRIKSFRYKNPDIKMFLLASAITEEEAKRAHEHYVDACCLKGENFPELINAIEEVI